MSLSYRPQMDFYFYLQIVFSFPFLIGFSFFFNPPFLNFGYVYGLFCLIFKWYFIFIFKSDFSFSSTLISIFNGGFKLKNKSCLNDLKFCEISQNRKLNIFWKFNCLSHEEPRNLPRSPKLGVRWFGLFKLIFLRIRHHTFLVNSFLTT